MTVVFDLD